MVVKITSTSDQIKSLNTSVVNIPYGGQGSVIIRMNPELLQEDIQAKLILEYDGKKEVIVITPQSLFDIKEETVLESIKSNIVSLFDPFILPIAYTLSPYFTEEQSKLILLFFSLSLFFLVLSCIFCNCFYSNRGDREVRYHQVGSKLGDSFAGGSGNGFDEYKKFGSWEDNGWGDNWNEEVKVEVRKVNGSPTVKQKLGIVRKSSSLTKGSDVFDESGNNGVGSSNIGVNSLRSSKLSESFGSDTASVSSFGDEFSPKFGSQTPKIMQMKKKSGGKLVIAKSKKPLDDSFWDDGWK